MGIKDKTNNKLNNEELSEVNGGMSTSEVKQYDHQWMGLTVSDSIFFYSTYHFEVKILSFDGDYVYVEMKDEADYNRALEASENCAIDKAPGACGGIKYCMRVDNGPSTLARFWKLS